jgi:hypothetical protein
MSASNSATDLEFQEVSLASVCNRLVGREHVLCLVNVAAVVAGVDELYGETPFCTLADVLKLTRASRDFFNNLLRRRYLKRVGGRQQGKLRLLGREAALEFSLVAALVAGGLTPRSAAYSALRLFELIDDGSPPGLAVINPRRPAIEGDQ